MPFLVNLTDRAQRDLALLYEEINAGDSKTARKWYAGLQEEILCLEHHPNRCPLTPESRKFRHLLYGNYPHVYRVIYRVLEKKQQVQVLHIRHGARRKFKTSDLRSTELGNQEVTRTSQTMNVLR